MNRSRSHSLFGDPRHTVGWEEQIDQFSGKLEDVCGINQSKENMAAVETMDEFKMTCDAVLNRTAPKPSF
ncbi:hypothetical protein [Legionella sp. W05-934-2]|jgi:hypothetical protein|uniref:hypothetical protein n=1 Tax=Legionella sp. W05-934-2 TaxID=1198649 RepID=UPI0034620648